MNAQHQQTIFADLSLARRLERTEARANADFVETRAKLFPELGACWIEVAGAYAMFDGLESPCTQTFGLGMFESATAEHLEQIERFFEERRAPVFHEVSPMADLSLLALLHQRGYYPIELTSVMYRPIGPGLGLAAPRNERITLRVVGPDEHELWAKTGAEGWSEQAELADQMIELGLVTAARSSGLSFLAELGGKPIATGALCIHEGVALLAGASTIPNARKQGAQLALLEGRLRHGVEADCDIAMMCAQPGSASQRNAERHGFRIAYTRIKWKKADS